MHISTVTETPEEFTVRVASLLNADSTHVYFDTSFLMWLTMIGDEARSQFLKWAEALGDRTHIPLWSMHEYYRHHAGGTLQADLRNRADELISAAKAFQNEVRKYADQPLMTGQSEVAYQESVDNALTTITELSAAAKCWDYDRCANVVISWMNSRTCELSTVFQSVASLGAKGAARYTQDIPPGFRDRTKEDFPTKGSNKFGDLLFWQEVIQHSQTVHAKSVIVITRDRKEDWFALGSEPNVELSWKRVKSKWSPVPSPHPTLAFELKIEAKAELVLLDELYLGALLWKFDRKNFERLASVAIAVAPGHFEKVDPPPRPVSLRAQKRRDQATIGLGEANQLLVAALGFPSKRVKALLAQLDRDAPLVEEFIRQLDVSSLEPLNKEEIANFARLLHDRARETSDPSMNATRKLLNLLDSMPADTAAATYLGFLCSAYLFNGFPLSRPDSPFLEEIFEWRIDTAMQVVLRAFSVKMKKLHSPAIYIPSDSANKLSLRIEHDSELRQNPVALVQIYINQKALLIEGEIRPNLQLRPLVGGAEATIDTISKALSRYYGWPLDLVDLQGGEANDRRMILEQTGLREFSRFDQGDLESEMPTHVADEDIDSASDEDDGDFPHDVEEDL